MFGFCECIRIEQGLPVDDKGMNKSIKISILFNEHVIVAITHEDEIIE